VTQTALALWRVTAAAAGQLENERATETLVLEGDALAAESGSRLGSWVTPHLIVQEPSSSRRHNHCASAMSVFPTGGHS